MKIPPHKPSARDKIRLLAQDIELARARKTNHLCTMRHCLECGNNTTIQMARNRIESLWLVTP